MSSSRILVGLDDSPAALAGARFAVDLAARLGARIRFVHVVGDGEVVRALHALRRDHGIVERRRREAESLVAHLVAEGLAESVAAEGEVLAGEPAPLLLAQAREWQADLLVLGRSRRSRSGEPPIGSVSRHVLEFAECPVLVVPLRPVRD